MNTVGLKLKKFLVLDSTEESVLTLLSSKGDLSVSEISETIKLARTSIYNALKKLISKRMVRRTGFKYMILDNEIVKYNSEKPNIDFLISNCLDEIANLKKGEIVYSIESDKEVDELFRDKKDFMSWQKKIVKNRIILKGIGSKMALKKFRQNLSPEIINDISLRSGSARFTNSQLDGYCNIIVFRDSVVFMSRIKKYFFRIDDRNVSFFMKNLIDVFDDLLDYRSVV